MKSVLITSYYFYPEIAPRAFRTYELAKEFAQRGYKVDVVIPFMDYDYSHIKEKYNFEIYQIDSGFLLNKNAKLITHNKTINEKNDTIFRKYVKKVVNIFYLDGRNFEYSFMLSKFLKSEKKDYDLVISIGMPICVHLGTALYLKKKKVVSIADCSDPFSFNQELKGYFYYKYIEKWILNHFSYITVPVEDAVEKYLFFKERDSINVVPQGFDFSNIQVSQYKQNDIVTFGYAGVFYNKIRNPKVLFDYLIELDIDFRFILYTTKNKTNIQLIQPYIDKLKNKLVIKDLIPREQCIYELSKMDFVINQNNSAQEQKPSKLIDYMLTSRPIFSFTQNELDTQQLRRFLDFKFPNMHQLKQSYLDELKYFDIKTIVDKLEALK